MVIRLDPRAAVVLLVVLQGSWAHAQEVLPLTSVPDKPSAVVGAAEQTDGVCCAPQVGACASCAHRYSRYPKACEHPLHVPRLGSTIGCHFMTQVYNGMAAQMVLREYDFDQQFNGNPVQLNAAGSRTLRRISNLLTIIPGPVVIEESARKPELSRQRREHVIAQLEALGITFDPSQIVVSTPAPIGLSGIEAELIQRRLMDQTQQGGAALPSATSGQGVVSPGGIGLGIGAGARSGAR